MKTTLAQAIEDYLTACEQAREAQVEHASAARTVSMLDGRFEAAVVRRDHLKVNLQTAIRIAEQGGGG